MTRMYNELPSIQLLPVTLLLSNILDLHEGHLDVSVFCR